MKTKITPQEWQTLSAYLDGQLPERERRQLESRLQTNEALRTSLDDLRRTRLLLRSLPRKRAPRNFTLTPAMIQAYQKQRGQATTSRFAWTFPTLRVASALATLLLVVTILGDLAISATLRYPSTAATSPALEAPMMEAAPAEGMQTDNQAEEPQERIFLAAPTEDPTVIARMTAAPPGMGGAAPGDAQGYGPLETPTPEMGVMAAPAEPEGEMAPKGPDPSERNAQDAVPEFTPEVLATGAAMTPDEPELFDWRNILRPMEITFAVVALVAGLAAFWLSRRS